MLYKNKYRVETTRLKEWDYTTPWWYFVTINTKNHIEWFGKIENGKMVLNKIGLVANEEWLKTNKLRTNVDLDYYVIMPNHIHGIIIINESVETTGSVVSVNYDKENYQHQKYSKETMQRIVSTTLKSNSLGSIVGQIKSACTKQIRATGINVFSWQKGFYERIIRNEKELYNIRKYIDENPLKWEFNKNENIDI